MQTPIEAEPLDDITSKLKSIKTFKEQVVILSQNLQPHLQDAFPKYRMICQDIHEALVGTFPQNCVNPFGSTVTGLSFSNSDVDVYISGVKGPHDDDKKCLNKTKKLLQYSKKFGYLLVIAHAKIPLLKCVHIATKINCDINFKNMLGVCNSNLIRDYMSLDGKVKILMIILKYWGKIHNITGRNSLFTNYSLSLMLIFYLQQKPFHFPAVVNLQGNSLHSRMHEGWNGGFQPLNSYLNQPLTFQTTLFELLKGFFAFYAQLEYNFNVICPFLGTFLKKSVFATPQNLPDSFHHYKEVVLSKQSLPLKMDAPVCIQDPFEHTRNITVNVAAAVLDKFVNFCQLGLKICQEGENFVLYKLLTELPEAVKSQTFISAENAQFSVEMGRNLRYLEGKISNKLENRQAAIQSAWFEELLTFSKIVFKDFLMFDVTELSVPTSSSKCIKVEGQNDVYKTDIQTKVVLSCVGKLNLWGARKCTEKESSLNISPNTTFIDKEVSISAFLYNQSKELALDNFINFNVTLEHVADGSKVVFQLKKNLAHKKSFKSFASFLSAKLPVWFELYQKDLNNALS